MSSQEMSKKYGKKWVGNVIRIIDERTILVNAGKPDLSVGNEIQVYELGEDIKDIDGRILSQYYHIKDTLEVVQTEDVYSICKKQEFIKEPSGFAFALSPLLETQKTRYIPLKIDKNDIQELKPNEPLIKIGDPIKLA